MLRAGFDILLAREGPGSGNVSGAYSYVFDLYADWPRPELATQFAKPLLSPLRAPGLPPASINAAVWPIVSHPGFEKELYTLAAELVELVADASSANGGILTRNTAARRVSRLARQINAMS